MIERLDVAYENMETASYLTVSFPKEVEPLHYQMEMITSNEITHFLKVSKRMMNGRTIAYYNISSRISLAQILDRRKLKREELIRIVEGAVAAMKEAGEYQLASWNLVMQPEYIYVDPANCDPDFLYLPLREREEQGLKELLLSLIMQGKIELSNDNFVQVLLEAVNSEPLSLERLESCMKQYQGNAEKKKTAGRPVQPIRPVTPVTPAPQVNPVVPPPQEVKEAVIEPQISNSEKPRIPLPGKPSAPIKGEKPGKEKKKKKEKDVYTSSNEEENGFDPEKAKKMFMLPQAVIMVVLCAMISFGAFTDAAGVISMDIVAATAIVVVVTEVILYREAYVNSKKPKAKKNSKGNSKKVQEKNVQTPLAAPGRSKPPVPPMKQPVQPLEQPVKEPQMSAQPVQTVRPVQPIPVSSVQPSVVRMPAASSPVAMNESEETELWEANQTGMSAYLEYYENGIMTRIPLDKRSILIGRLKGQVDFVLQNPKVGKVHAEFLNQDGVIYVRDLNSKNGTYINGNGQRIGNNVPYPLHDNDRVMLADSELVLRCYGQNWS